MAYVASCTMKLILAVVVIFLVTSLGEAHLVLHNDDLCKWVEGRCEDNGCISTFANGPSPHTCRCVPLDKQGCEYRCECDPTGTSNNEQCPAVPTSPSPLDTTTTRDPWQRTTRDPWQRTTRNWWWRTTRDPWQWQRTTRNWWWRTTRDPWSRTTRDPWSRTTNEPMPEV